MKLIAAHITNFRSILDSAEFSIDQVTCLVGKNEAGKTAVLQALERLRPLKAGDSKQYNQTLDYPRRYLSQYSARHKDGEAKVIQTKWKLDPDDVEAIEEEFGSGVVTAGHILTVSKSYGSDTTIWSVPFNEAKAVGGMVASSGLTTEDQKAIGTHKTSSGLFDALAAIAEPTDGHKKLKERIATFRKNSAELKVIDILSPRLPKFLYSSSFDRMPGKVSVQLMQQARQAGQARPTENEEAIFRAFLDLAGITLEELQQTQKLEELTAKLEAASNSITDQIFEYWSQNTSLEIKVKAQPGLAQDPPPFNSGTVVEARVENRIHRMTVPFSERSAGFVWFFSFLVLFSQIKEEHGPVIILLDEPGLNLHAKAQYDLLRFIKEKLAPHHQVIYTTHSPFMVPADNLASVRTVEDVVTRLPSGKDESHGTKVSEDVLSVSKDTLFPLQAALGYELSQTLFVGKNVLLVEGPSDVLYLQAASAALKKRRREGLDTRWVVCPTSGIDKVHTFASLFSGNKLNITVLTDYAKGDKTKVENLKKSGILEASRVFLATDFCGQTEADVEDWFGADVLCEIVNKAYELPAANKLTQAKLTAAENTPRRIKQVEACFRTMPASVAEFDHFMPASWLIRNVDLLDATDAETTAALDRFENFFKKINQHL